jgi:hypothetical protein
VNKSWVKCGTLFKRSCLRMTKKVKSTVVEGCDLEVWDEAEGTFVTHYPSKYYIVNSLGQYVFYHCRNRSDAQAQANKDFGEGKYSVRQASMGSGSGNYTCVGVATRARPSSRAPK